MRKCFWLGVGLAAVVGCGQTSSDDVNNSLPPNPPPGSATGASPEEAAGSTYKAPSGYYPSDYPGMKKGEAKAEGGEAKAEGGEEVKTGAEANKEVTPPPAEGEAAPAEPKAEGEGEAPKTSAVTLEPEEVAQIEKIADPAERELALAQKLCPVGSEEDPTGGHLGAMGKPIKVEHNGKVAFLCCKGCEKAFKADPEKYIARAEAARAAK